MQDFWNKRYEKEEYFYGTKPNHFLRSISGIFTKHSKILCLADGEGRNSVFLASLGHEVTAVDFSEAGFKKATLLAEKKQVDLNYIISDLSEFDFGLEKWDGIVSIFCHLSPDLRSIVHQKIQTGLRPGGIFIIEAYHPKQLEFSSGGPKDLQMLYTEEILRSNFRNLEWIKLENNLVEIFEGQGHHGLSCVLDGVARKFNE